MHGWYELNEFCSIRYYTDFGSGLWWTAETNDRVKNDYGVGGYPTVIFQGTERVVGGSATIATGEPYRDVYVDLKKPSPFKLEITNLDLPGGTLDAYLEVVSDPGGPTTGMSVRGAAYEDGLMDGGDVHDRVTRDVLTPVPVTASQVGDSMNLTMPIDTSEYSNLANGGAVVFVQDGAAGPIYQAACHSTPPNYAMNYYAGKRFYMVQAPSVFATENLVVFNEGTRIDNFRARVATDFAPGDWTVEVSDGAFTDPLEVSTSISPGQSQNFHLNVTAASLGYGQFSVELQQDGRPSSTSTITFTVLTERLPILVVDDDGGENAETAYTDALDVGGFTYGVWPGNQAEIKADDLRTICIVVWNTGATGTVSDADRDVLTPFLERGGKLLIAGNQIASGLSSAGGPAAAWLENYLSAIFTDESPIASLRVLGNPGDPVGDAVDASSNNMLGVDILSPGPGAFVSLYYGTTTTYPAGIRADGTYKTVLFGFDLSLLAEVPQHELLMTQIIDWLELCQGCASGIPGPIMSFKAHRSAGDIVFSWVEDPAVEDGYNIYGTDDRTQAGALRTDAGCNDCTPLFSPPVPGATFTYANGINDGPMYYQILGVCGGVNEGPN
ncbi:hypothetical protein ACFLU6_12615 [Acidobacteriota bacterium]